MAENKPLWKQMQIIKMGLTTKLIIKMYCDDLFFLHNNFAYASFFYNIIVYLEFLKHCMTGRPYRSIIVVQIIYALTL